MAIRTGSPTEKPPSHKSPEFNIERSRSALAAKYSQINSNIESFEYNKTSVTHLKIKIRNEPTKTPQELIVQEATTILNQHKRELANKFTELTQNTPQQSSIQTLKEELGLPRSLTRLEEHLPRLIQKITDAYENSKTETSPGVSSEKANDHSVVVRSCLGLLGIR